MKNTLGQLIRYGVVGLASNLALFLAYLLITHAGMGHKLSMSLLYATGTALTFVFNRNWTFKHDGHISRSFLAYIAIYAFGYVVNWIALYVLVDRLAYPHQLVQGCMIIVLAVLLFILQKFVVFRES